MFYDDQVTAQYSESCCCLGVQSCPTLCDPWTVAHQAPLSMGFSRQEYWSGLPFPSPTQSIEAKMTWFTFLGISQASLPKPVLVTWCRPANCFFPEFRPHLNSVSISSWIKKFCYSIHPNWPRVLLVYCSRRMARFQFQTCKNSCFLQNPLETLEIANTLLVFFFYIYNFIYFWPCWVFVALCRASLVAVSGAGGYSL